MKICFFANSMFKIGGEQRITSLLANELVKKGIEVTIIIKNKEQENNLYNLDKKVNLIFLNSEYDFRLNNKKIYEYLRKINRKTGIFKYNKKIIKEFFVSNKILEQLKYIFSNNEFDIVVGIAGDRSFILAYIKEYLKKSKLVYWNHQSVLAHFKYKNTRYYNEESFIIPLMNKFDEIVCLNEHDSQFLKENYHLNSITINNCKSFTSRKKTNLNNKKFLACGRLTSQKNFLNLIEAMRLFKENNCSYKLDIYGEGPLEKKIIKRIKKYKLEDIVSIYKNESDIQSVYLSHDIFLMTSLYEGFGLVTLEALECGLPVIAYDLDINKEIVGKNGFLVESFNYESFSEKMIILANDYNLRKQIQKEIPRNIEKYSKKRFVEEWLSLIKKIITK